MTEHTELLEALRLVTSQCAYNGAVAISLRAELVECKAERDQWKNDALNGGNAAFLRDELAQCKVERDALQAKLDELMVELASSIVDDGNSERYSYRLRRLARQYSQKLTQGKQTND